MSIAISASSSTRIRLSSAFIFFHVILFEDVRQAVDTSYVGGLLSSGVDGNHPNSSIRIVPEAVCIEPRERHNATLEAGRITAYRSRMGKE
jgi:hypothetical protein